MCNIVEIEERSGLESCRRNFQINSLLLKQVVQLKTDSIRIFMHKFVTKLNYIA